MIRKVFNDFIIAIALCLVIWGVAPAWAGCIICTQSVLACPRVPIDTGLGELACEHQGENCGTRWSWGVTYNCSCGFKTNLTNSCWCRIP